MLIGNYTHSIDIKGRVFMPAKFREELGENFIVCQGICHGTMKCLFVFSNDAWMEFAAKLKAVPITDQKGQEITRLLFASACECIPDKQGRILIPQRLRDFADISDEAVVNGAMTRVEMWGKNSWDNYCNNAQTDYEDAVGRLAEFGI